METAMPAGVSERMMHIAGASCTALRTKKSTSVHDGIQAYHLADAVDLNKLNAVISLKISAK
jgi:hypothetical protein